MVMPNDLNKFTAVSYLHIKICYQFTCTEQKAPDNSDCKKSSPNYESLEENLLLFTLTVLRILMLLLNFRYCVDPHIKSFAILAYSPAAILFFNKKLK
jgi:hypothetical protein